MIDKVTAISEAMKCVKSGDIIMIGGFTLSGSPIGLLRKLSELPITGLTAISEDCGYISDDGEPYILELPLRADVALVKAYRADRMGNAVFKYSAQNFNPLMATAADKVVLEVEEIVEPGKINPEQVQLPGVFVDYVVHCPEEVIL